MIPQYRVTWTEQLPAGGGLNMAVEFRGLVYDSFDQAERERKNRAESHVPFYNPVTNEETSRVYRYLNVRIEARVKSEEPWQ